MNLVQINERLKSLPMQVIQQYANGMNPEVPPYLALGELQRRELSQKQMANQGGQQGPQPSVKEQVEQKAGLMALQQMQQQQMAQQMQQPRGPMPIPPGAPQPEMQPQPEMMARGGLAGIPVRSDMFEYAGGGIIAFQSGGQPKYETRIDKMYRENRGELTEEERKRKEEIEALISQIPRDENIVQGGEKADSTELERNIKNTLMALPGASASRALSGSAGSSRGTAAALTALMNKRDEQAPAEEAKPRGPMITSQGPGDVFAPRYPQGLPDALQKVAPARPAPARATAAPMPSAPRPAQVAAPAAAPAAQTGLPAALAGAPEFSPTPVSPDRAEVEAMMKAQRRTAPTAEQIKSDVSALMPAGMQEEAMQKRFAEQRARADARERGYKESQPSGLDNLIRVLGQAGQYKGFSGIGPAYTSMQQQRRAEDLAFQKQQDELMTAIEGREYGADKDVFSTRSTAMDRAQQLFGQSEKSILEAAAKKYEVSQGALTKDNEAKMKLDAERFRAIQEEKLKRLELGSQEKRVQWQLANQNIIEKQGVEYVNILAQSRAERAKGTPQSIAKADALEARAKNIETVIGRSGSGGGGAGAGPKPMTRDQAADNVTRLLETFGKEKNDSLAEAKSALIASGIPNPTMAQIREHLIQEQMKGVSLSPTAPSGVIDKSNPLLK
jgi:hypothetical protein